MAHLAQLNLAPQLQGAIRRHEYAGKSHSITGVFVTAMPDIEPSGPISAEPATPAASQA